eukprot:COSAG02_NODE_475_length_21552_cov_4.236470_16_plen_67_part_00
MSLGFVRVVEVRVLLGVVGAVGGRGCVGEGGDLVGVATPAHKLLRSSFHICVESTWLRAVAVRRWT